MSYKKIVNENIQSGLIKRIADDILQGIEKVYQKKDLSSRRWIWELLQNAKDVPNRFSKVKVKIELSRKNLILSHNGDPFTVQNLTNLIMQVSSKFEDENEEDDEVDDVTGKFGTGFLVTHLLSKELVVKGVVKEESEIPKRFSISMDRSDEKVRVLMKKMNDALNELQNLDSNDLFNSEPNYDNSRTENDFDTSFIYDLVGENSFNYADKGVQDLVNTLPLTLIFVGKIKEIIVDDKPNNRLISFELKQRKLENGVLNTVNIINKKDTSQNEELYFWTFSEGDKNDKVTSAIQITSPYDFSPLEWNSNTPRLYRDFPLIGSENFHLPLVVNGHGFYPDETRSKLLIEDEKGPKDINNKRLFLSTIELIKRTINSLPINAKNNLYRLAISKIPDVMPFDWYEEEVQKPFRKFLLEQNLVNNSTSLIKIKESKFPEAGNSKEINDSFFDIVLPFLGKDILPIKEELNHWLKVIAPEYKTWGFELKYEISDLIKAIENKNIDDIVLKDDLKNRYEWLNSFYQFLEENKMHKILNEFAITPNKKGDLIKLDELFVNDGIHDVFLDIYTELDEDFSPKLIHTDIKLPFDGHQLKENRSIGTMINDKIDDNFDIKEDKHSILHSILRIFPSQEGSKRSRLFNAFSTFYKLNEDKVIIPGVQEEFNFDKALNYAVKYLLSDIGIKENIVAISNHLNKSEDETIVWLNNLIQDVRDELNEYKIIPTKAGGLNKLSELFINDGIYDDFLDIYKILQGKDYAINLIHSSINIPITGHQSNNNKFIGDAINTLIKDQSFEHRDDITSIIFSLLRISPPKIDTFRNSLLKSFTDFFSLEFNYNSISNLKDEDFNFDPIVKRSLEVLLNGIYKTANITSLSMKVNIDHDTTINWLDDLLRAIVGSKYKEYIAKYNIFPNQYEEFRAFEELENDGIEDNPLPTELLDILKAFDSKEDWRKDLLLDGIGVKANETRKIVILSSSIENNAQRVFNAMTGEGIDEQQISTLMSIVKWTTKNKPLAEEHFKWILEKKPLINTIRIENPLVQDAIYDLIEGDNDKIITLTKLSKQMTNDQLEEISELANEVGVDNITAISSLAKSLSKTEIEQLAEITAEIGTSKLMKMAIDELEKRRDFEFKKKIGDNVETIFKQTLDESGTGFNILKREGPFDFLIINPQNDLKYYIELKSIGGSLDYIKMAESQAEFSADNTNRYSLCVIQRPYSPNPLEQPEITPDFIKDNLMSVTNIGNILMQTVNTVKPFNNLLHNKSNNGIGIEFRDSEFHYTVPEEKWQNGSNFNELIEKVKEELKN